MIKINPGNDQIKFKGSVDFDTGLGVTVYDSRIKANDCVLWSYGDAGTAQAPYMIIPLVSDGEIWFYPAAIIYDPGSELVRINFIVFDGSNIPS